MLMTIKWPKRDNLKSSYPWIHTILEKYGFLISEQWKVLLIKVDEPTSYDESLHSSEYEKWLEAMKSEIDSM